MKLSEKSTIFHHHSTANINSLPFLQHPAPSQAMSLCERFGSKQRPLEPKQMNALKVLRPIRDARREGLDGTGWEWVDGSGMAGASQIHWIFLFDTRTSLDFWLFKPRLVELDQNPVNTVLVKHVNEK